ncbi:hypothetical protein BN129_1880 [Cronobacter sakazakii 701]|nr:hypothetical protein BN129_1880 [Cronobacter sakazakii 701]
MAIIVSYCQVNICLLIFNKLNEPLRLGVFCLLYSLYNINFCIMCLK